MAATAPSRRALPRKAEGNASRGPATPHLQTVQGFYDAHAILWTASMKEALEISEGIYEVPEATLRRAAQDKSMHLLSRDASPTSFKQAVTNIHQWWLDQGRVGPGVRVLELGFGYGTLGVSVTNAGGDWAGINANAFQVDYARRNLGLSGAEVMDWRQLPGRYAGRFDVVFARGCLEHYVSSLAEAGSDRPRALYEQLLRHIEACLDPQSRIRRFVCSMIFLRHAFDPGILTMPRADIPQYTDAYFLRQLSEVWGGYYPSSMEEFLGIRRMKDLVHCEDGTRDYYYSSLDWTAQTSVWAYFRNPLATARVLAQYGPAYLRRALRANWENVWRWQFIPRADVVGFSDTPCRLQRFVVDMPTRS